jgi:hypothetical protein
MHNPFVNFPELPHPGFAQKDPVLNVGMVQRLNRAQTVSHTIVGQLK